VDALIVGFITDYQPYDHPRVGVLLMMYPPAAEPAPTEEAVALVRLNRVYDSETKQVAGKVREFASTRGSQEGPLGERQYLLVMSKYMHFVADQSIRELFDKARYSGLRMPVPAKRRQSETITEAQPTIEEGKAEETDEPVEKAEPETTEPEQRMN